MASKYQLQAAAYDGKGSILTALVRWNDGRTGVYVRGYNDPQKQSLPCASVMTTPDGVSLPFPYTTIPV